VKNAIMNFAEGSSLSSAELCMGPMQSVRSNNGMAAKAGKGRHPLRKILVFAGRSDLKAGRQI
jgi:hypothetical protein